MSAQPATLNQATQKLREHPIKILVENGVPVTINTDALLVFDTSVDEEYLRLYEAGTLTAEQLDEIRCWGIRASIIRQKVRNTISHIPPAKPVA